MRLKSYFGPDSHLRVRATESGYAVSFYIEDKEPIHKNQPIKINSETETINV